MNRTLYDIANDGSEYLDRNPEDFGYVLFTFSEEGRVWFCRGGPGQDIPGLLRELAERMEEGAPREFGSGRPAY